jgi:CMP-N-acetylneuraminic acid synthetase
MICALLVDPDDSPDFPGNTAEVMGRPLAAYPLMAAKGSSYIRRLYAQTTSPVVARVAAQYGAQSLLPPEAAGDARLSDEALIVHAWRQIADDLKTENDPAELVVILFANTGAVNSQLINEGVQAMLDDAKLDSAATVSDYDRWTPRRALRETPEGRLAPYAERVTAAGTAWFPDWGAVIVRPRVLDALTPASEPLAYLGTNILPLK